MQTKSTVYLPGDLKAALAREAERRGCSEAQIIREAIAAVVQRPAPTPGIIHAPAFADRADELLDGFGTR